MAKLDSTNKQTVQQLDLADKRARQAASQQRNQLITLATASLGIFFLSLTINVEPPLTQTQSVSVLASLSAMSLSVLAGLIAWYADGRRNYFWATAIQSGDGLRRKRLFALRSRWYIALRRAGFCQWVLFMVGVGGAVTYIVYRILGE